MFLLISTLTLVTFTSFTTSLSITYGCVDTDENCAQFADLGYCEPSSSYYAYMVTNCKSSCGACAVPTLSPTLRPTLEPEGDLDDTDSDCCQFALQGYCKPDSVYYSYMKQNCKKACSTWFNQIECPKDYYKSASGECVSCPAYTHTEGENENTIEECVCDDGFERTAAGSTCTDINECLEGNGGCDQDCVNTPGSYVCMCNQIPGYIVDPQDKTKCIVVNSCKNLTHDDSPRNGGIVCYWNEHRNSQYCSVRCNPGYEHPSGVNHYEVCGPQTDYQWSHSKRNGESSGNPFAHCIESFFPGITMEADIFYFNSTCADLTHSEEEEERNEFADVLNDKTACYSSPDKLCDVQGVGIICGESD